MQRDEDSFEGPRPMAQPVKYKPPRRINSVSVTLALLLALGGYLTYQYLPMYLQRQEVYRVLEEHGSTLAGRKGFYSHDHAARESLRRKMEAEIRRMGVMDPQLETWIEIDQHQAHLGAIYTETITWPFDVIAAQTNDYEVEHVVSLQ